MARQEAVLCLPLGLIFFTVCVYMPGLKITYANEQTDRSDETAVDEFKYHEIFLPLMFSPQGRIHSTFSKGEHLHDVTLLISAFNKNFTLDLKINRELLTNNYVERLPHSKGFHVIQPSEDHRRSHCFYHGDVRGHAHSMAALSTCDGISGFISDEKEFYHIEPIPHDSKFAHRMYRDSDRKKNNMKCGLSHGRHEREVTSQEATANIMKRVKRNIHGPYDSNAKSRYVELFLVSDNRMYQKQRSVKKLTQRSKAITNIVSRLYKPLNIYVALVGAEVWKDGDQITITSDPNKTLDNFLRYRRERINPTHPNDNAQLLTGQIFDDGVVGKAVKGPICTFQFSGGVNMDYSALVSSVATTVAHELGHNFGMHHDNDSCVCPQDKCIMAATSGGPNPTLWSSCSKKAVADAFDHGMDYCLRNKPAQLFDGPVCGNGFVEDGEQCDCGIPEACESLCCNATTCRMHPNAACATGECCDTDTCRFKSGGTVCRAEAGECDFAEYCDGSGEYCPHDIFKQNGISCVEAFCYEGQCTSHTDQCKLLWGPTGYMSDELCYTSLNKNGKSTGNCGYNWVRDRFTACRPEDVLCGMLHCVHLNEKLMYWKDVYAKSSPATFLEVTNTGKKFVCRGVVLDVGLNMPDPGMVPNGARCGQEKMCVDQKCTPVEDVPSGSWTGTHTGMGTGPGTGTDAPRSCSQKCSGNGQCNSRGNCHCDPGYAPPYCDKSGEGCSVDSGPCHKTGGQSTSSLPRSPSSTGSTTEMHVDRINVTELHVTQQIGPDKSGLLAGLLVLFLLIIPLIVLLGVAYFKRERLQVWWKKQDFLKYRVPSIGKPPPQPSVTTQPSVQPSTSSRDNKFRNVSFRNGNPPSISNPVLTSSTNRNSQAFVGGPQSMETFKPADEGTAAGPAIYNNIPPPRPPPPRPKSFHEQMSPSVDFQGGHSTVSRSISVRDTDKPPGLPQRVPMRPPTSRQQDIMQLQDTQADKAMKFENSRLTLKPSVNISAGRAGSSSSQSPPAQSDQPCLVSALKARFDGDRDGHDYLPSRGGARTRGAGGPARGSAAARSGSSTMRGGQNSPGGSTPRGGTTGRGASASRGGTKSRGRSNNSGSSPSSVNRSNSKATNRPPPPPKPRENNLSR